MTATLATRSPRELVATEQTPLSAACGREPRYLWLTCRLAAVVDLIDESVTRYGTSSTPITGSGPTDLMVRASELPPRPGFEGEGTTLRSRALDAIGELRAALTASEREVASFAGIDRNTVRSWRLGERSPYPATVRRLFELQSVVRVVDALQFPGGVRAWLAGAGPEGVPRREILQGSGGIAALTAELRPAFFERPTRSSLPTGDELDALDALGGVSTLAGDEEFSSELRPGTFDEPVVRARKVP